MTDRQDERMQQRLAAAGRRWQAELPPPPAVELDRLDDAPPRRLVGRGVGVAAAAAAVVLATGLGIGLVRVTGGDASGPSHQPTATPTEHGVPVSQEVVPWRDLPARHPELGHLVHGKLVTRYDRVWASGHIGGSVHPGDTLVFVVTLQSPTRIVLDPCPDYSIAFGQKAYVTRQLNCTQVPYYASVPGPHGKMSDFRPTLPANTPVSFRMRITVPDERGQQKVLWTLDGPQRLPGFYGIVRVTPRP